MQKDERKESTKNTNTDHVDGKSYSRNDNIIVKNKKKKRENWGKKEGKGKKKGKKEII